MNAADKYFLKAKDNYPYNIEDAIEALEYGLSCDSEHPGLLALMGYIYYNDLGKLDNAFNCFEQALLVDAAYIDTYYAYIKCAIDSRRYKKAARLIAAALTLPNADLARVMWYEAMMLEKQGHYAAALSAIKKAIQNCFSSKCSSFYKEEQERVEAKSRVDKESKQSLNIILR